MIEKFKVLFKKTIMIKYVTVMCNYIDIKSFN